MTGTIRLLALLAVMSLTLGATVIDSFTGAGVVFRISDSVVDGNAVPLYTNGNRTIFADLTGGPNGVEMSTVVLLNAEGYFAGSAESEASGRTGADYTGMWDLTAPEMGLSIELVSNDLLGSTISFWISDGSNTAMSPEYDLPVVSKGQASQVILAMFSGFSGIDSVTMSKITSLGFVNKHVADGDLALDNFGTHMAPEPGTYALMAAGLVGLYFVRRRKA